MGTPTREVRRKYKAYKSEAPGKSQFIGVFSWGEKIVCGREELNLHDLSATGS
jgi:hypothetical protein